MKPGLLADMPFLVNDWLSSTAISMMLPMEEAGFLRLLLHAWSDQDCCLPDDDAALAALSRLGEAWNAASAKIRACFESDPARPGKIFNAKQRSLRYAQTQRVTAAREQRKNAANARWKKKRPQSGSNCSRNATALRKDMRGDASILNAQSIELNNSALSPVGAGAPKEKPARPPTVEEIIAFGAELGIPTSCCEAFHATAERKCRWFRDGLLLSWKAELQSLWEAQQ